LTSWDGTYRWTGVEGATWYHLEVQDTEASIVLSNWYAVSENCVGLICAVTPAETLSLPNGTYRWRILDYGSYGYGLTTEFQSFTLHLP
jgi:hypothetical protein